MKLSEYLYRRITEAGAKTLFGIPGDFALPLFRSFEQLGADMLTFLHEPALGYAADAYARLNGFAAAIVTYGAGGLNMVNAIAQAYAEKSPVLVISGAPEIMSRRKNLMVHHRVGSFETQIRIYGEICCTTALLERVDVAAREIDHVINRILFYKRPGYIEVPRDLIDCDIFVPENLRPLEIRHDREFVTGKRVETALTKLTQSLACAKRPVLYLGVEIRRLGLEDKVLRIIDQLHLPFTTSLDGKAVVPETHPRFVGTYMGAVGPASAREALEGADLVLNLGATISDVNMGLFSAVLNPVKTIHATTEGLSFFDQSFPDVTLPTVVDRLSKLSQAVLPLSSENSPLPVTKLPTVPPDNTSLSTDGIIAIVNDCIAHHPTTVVIDVGDMLFASTDIRADVLLAPSYYAAMGFAVPAAVAAALSMPERRVLALVGDGSFFMTGIEIATLKRRGLSALVVVLNNGGYATMRALDRDNPMYDVPECNFGSFAHAFGIAHQRVTTIGEFRLALEQFGKKAQTTLIEAIVPPGAESKNLKTMHDLVHQKTS